MTKSYKGFIKSMSNSSLKVRQGTLKNLLSEPNKTELLEKKIAWLTEHLKAPASRKKNSENFSEHYHVRLARKYLNLEKSARDRNKPFNLKLSDVHSLLSESRCYYSGVKFNENNVHFKRTIDRKDYSKGYVKGE